MSRWRRRLIRRQERAAQKRWDDAGGTVGWLSTMFGTGDEMHYLATAPSPFMRAMRGERADGARQAYVTEFDPPRQAASFTGFDKGYAENYFDGVGWSNDT